MWRLAKMVSGFLVILIAMRGPEIAAMAWVNTAMILVTHQVPRTSASSVAATEAAYGVGLRDVSAAPSRSLVIGRQLGDWSKRNTRALDVAAPLLTKAIEFDTWNSQANRLLGRWHLVHSRPRPALQSFQRLFARQAEYPLVAMEQGDARRALGDVGGALEAYARLGYWVRREASVDLLLALADEQRQSGDFESACSNLVTALELMPGSPAVLLELSKVTAGKRTALSEEINQRLSHFRVGQFAVDDDSYRGRLARAVCELVSLGTWRLADANLVIRLWTGQEHFAEAERVARCVAERLPTSSFPSLWLGLTARAEGQLREAVNAFQTALALDSQFADAYLELGKTYSELASGLSDDGELRRNALLQSTDALRHHQALAPGDLRSLIRLARLCQVLNCPDEAQLQQQMQVQLGSGNPKYPVDLYKCNSVDLYDWEGWNLYGFDVLDEEAFFSTGWGETWFYWQQPPGWTPKALNDILLPDGRVIQMRDVSNMVPNAGFEWNDAGPGTPQGYEGGQAFATVLTQRDGQVTQAARTPEAGVWTMLSVPVSVLPEHHYLIGGWSRTSNGRHMLFGLSYGGGCANLCRPLMQDRDWWWQAEIRPLPNDVVVTRFCLYDIVPELVDYDNMVLVALELPGQ